MHLRPRLLTCLPGFRCSLLPAGLPTLQRPVRRDVVQQLVAALAAARPHASSECRGSPAARLQCGWAGYCCLFYCTAVLCNHALLPAASAATIAAAGHIVWVAEAVAEHMQAEISAGDRLRDLLQPRR